MDEKQLRKTLTGLDEAGRIRALARLMTVTFEQANLARKAAFSAQKAALLAKNATRAAALAARTAVDVSKWALKQGELAPEAAKKAARSVEAAQEALRMADAAVKAADSLQPGRKRMEEHMSSLTRSEKKVYPFLARGKTDKEIGKELGISTRTASFHVTNIKAKLGIDDRDDFILPSPLLS